MQAARPEGVRGRECLWCSGACTITCGVDYDDGRLSLSYQEISTALLSRSNECPYFSRLDTPHRSDCDLARAHATGEKGQPMSPCCTSITLNYVAYPSQRLPRLLVGSSIGRMTWVRLTLVWSSQIFYCKSPPFSRNQW
jgi:hypothetical protein